jgi:GT2 family glycosyltransferase
MPAQKANTMAFSGEYSVAACVLHWGDPELTKRCVDSLQAQLPAVSVLVVANDDQWRPGLGRSPEVIRTGQNLGYTGGMNAGLRWAVSQGFEFVALLTNDGWFPERNSLAILTDALRTNERIAACGPKLFRRVEDGSMAEWSVGTRSYPKQAPEPSVHRPEGLPSSSAGVGWIGGSCIVMRTGAVRDVGPLDDRFFMYLDDVDWCYRALIHGWYLCRDDRASYFEEASASTSRVPGLREYYMTRNGLVTARRYRGALDVATATLRALRMTLGLARRRDPLWRWVAQGTLDFYLGRMGPNRSLHVKR